MSVCGDIEIPDRYRYLSDFALFFAVALGRNSNSQFGKKSHKDFIEVTIKNSSPIAVTRYVREFCIQQKEG
jgi:hypothetical protein